LAQAIQESSALKRVTFFLVAREHQRDTVTLSESEEDWLHTEYRDHCTTEVQEHVSLETVRQILAKIPESLAEEIRTHQLYLTTEKKLAPGSLQVVVAALRFPYSGGRRGGRRRPSAAPSPPSSPSPMTPFGTLIRVTV
jgi:hypothetical protein